MDNGKGTQKTDGEKVQEGVAFAVVSVFAAVAAALTLGASFGHFIPAPICSLVSALVCVFLGLGVGIGLGRLR